MCPFLSQRENPAFASGSHEGECLVRYKVNSCSERRGSLDCLEVDVPEETNPLEKSPEYKFDIEACI